ncbi:hypothetical protein L6452_30787 [Arctium lappa]|uniref:Uncharacterized protein n=1 Tax=Arctium lappa TaxID=4217 RepID=A0ACB8ZK31_ARCLA|nr:hypothetical protein L6452_30787 [Arctium lappa]
MRLNLLTIFTTFKRGYPFYDCSSEFLFEIVDSFMDDPFSFRPKKHTRRAAVSLTTRVESNLLVQKSSRRRYDHALSDIFSNNLPSLPNFPSSVWILLSIYRIRDRIVGSFKELLIGPDKP